MFKVTFIATRENTTTPWGDPDGDENYVFKVLSEAIKRNISVVEFFSLDNLTRRIIWESPTEEAWREFCNNFLHVNGKINDSWYIANNITFKIVEEYIDE